MELAHIQTRFYFGWYPDLPDPRDYTITSPIIKKNLKLKKTGVRPKQVDLRASCTAIDNQGKLGSCTANAGVGLLEYYEKSKASTNSNFDGPRLFLSFLGRKPLTLGRGCKAGLALDFWALIEAETGPSQK